MNYMNVDGEVYCRYALMPPVINSEKASEYGIKVPWLGQPGRLRGPELGRNVKLRLVIDRGKRKMTCHAKIDWFKPDPMTGQLLIGLGSLSLTNAEFDLLERNFVEEPRWPIEFGVRLRDKATEAEPVTVTDEAGEIMRMMAVNLPVSLVEQIDLVRGETSFSEFVADALRKHLKR
jgi:hypothetical protein